ncbi:hypothetical protein BUALT_Bualt18G0016500 [Buddleja alternifolia]|uniref:Uncharacterized protein n=1 Tax=Buddleja alternifolia TaxID=168488 RepID=A0AAV6W9R7_9LAMI|nr:hypothetical protein BUALT_Bualt18G0016500 [Buddleja alternifolia]
MKFFSEMKLCWGGAVVSPAAAEGNSDSHSTSKRPIKVKSTGKINMQWQPKLHVISEDTPMLEVGNGGVAGFDDKKRSLKVKPKSTAKAAPPLSHREDYWKGSYTMALPAFSPTPLLF